jgi:tripartite-type tricarboxylate transporter receptor subunit TctC
VRALGVTGTQRSPYLPDVATYAESGLKTDGFDPFYAIVVAASTPREIMNALAEALAKAASTADFRAQFEKVVASEVRVNSPAEMLKMAHREADLIATIVKSAGITPE